MLTHCCEPNHKLFYKREKLMANHYPTDTKEIWKTISIPDFKGLYEASNLGRIRRTAPGWRTYAGRILKAPCNSAGYPHLALSRNGKSKYYLVHQLITLAFFGPCPDGREINHKDGVKTNNRLDNLEYVTPSENQQHALACDLRTPAHGEQHFRAKLTEKDVRDIRVALANGASLRGLGRKYGVHATAIRDIGLGKTWKHVL